MKKSSFIQNIKLVVAIIAVAVTVLLAQTCAGLIASASVQAAPEDVTIAPNSTSIPEVGGPLVIRHKIFDLKCGNHGEVLNAIIYAEISGGIPPYQVEFDPGDLIIPDIRGSFIIFTLKGGKSLTIKAKSHTVDGEPMDSYDVYAPSHHLLCEEQAFMDTPMAVSTFTMFTPTSTPTRSFNPSPTVTKDKYIYHTPTKTPRSNSTGTSTATSTDTSINTSTPTSTSISTATPTNTRAPTATPTNTRAPTATPTNTRAPTATPTPTNTPHPNQSECEDNIDNDSDGKIDLLDPQCKSSSDNHEEK